VESTVGANSGGQNVAKMGFRQCGGLGGSGAAAVATAAESALINLAESSRKNFQVRIL